ncbi:hypothetical protein [Nibricoccus sp. IMCC34717]|uniref:hypothetical protein n=1 Tax=Nibricoccus sp. IMCC34717 TaxID=3034021 RepID=UPI00384D9781
MLTAPGVGTPALPITIPRSEPKPELPRGWRYVDKPATDLPPGWRYAERDPEDPDTQSDWKDAGGMLARGALDDGVGSALEGGARIVLGARGGGAQAVADFSAGLGLTERGEIEGKISKLEAEENAIWSKKEGPWAQPQYPFTDAEHARLDAIKQELGALRQARAGMRWAPGVQENMRQALAASQGVADFREGVRDAYPVDKDFQQSKTGQVISGLGQAVGNVPAMLSGLGLPAAAAQLFDQSYQDAKQNDADEETAITAGIANMPAGVLEYAADKVQLGGLLEAFKAGKVAKETLAKEIMRRGAQAIATEASTEGAQQLWQNKVAQINYDPKRALTEGAGDAMVVGGFTGGIVSGLSTAAGRAVNRRSQSESPSPSLDAINEALANDTGKNVPEAMGTLQAQQKALVEGRVPAQMFPAGSIELVLPKGLKRVETPRGVFHFDPDQISAEKVTALSAAKRENEILGLGPYSKEDVAKQLAQGDALVNVAERDAQGREVRTAVAAGGTAAHVAADMQRRAAPGNTVAAEAPTRSILERLQASAEEQAVAAAEAKAREQVQRSERKAALQAKKDRFNEVIQIAEQTAKAAEPDFARVQGALETVQSYAEDGSIGLSLEQRQRAAHASARLQQIYDRLAPAAEAERDQRVRAAAEFAAQQQKETQQKLAQEKRDFAKQRAEGIGADGGIDYARLREERLVTLAQEGDKRAAKELDRRVYDGDGSEEADLLEALKSVKLPESDPALGGELALLVKEGMTPAQRRQLTGSRHADLDRVAHVLAADYGFTQIKTPADVVEYADRAMRGERILPERGGQVDFAAAAMRNAENRLTKGVTQDQLNAKVQPTKATGRTDFSDKKEWEAFIRPRLEEAKSIVATRLAAKVTTTRDTWKHAARSDSMSSRLAWQNIHEVLNDAVPIGGIEEDNASRPHIEGVQRLLAVINTDQGQQALRITLRKNKHIGWILHEIDDFGPSLRERAPRTVRPSIAGEVTDLMAPASETVAQILEIVNKEADGSFTVKFAEKPARADAQHLSEREIETLEEQLRKRFPALLKDYDLHIGALDKLLRAQGYAQAIPENILAAIYRERSRKSTVIIASKYLTDQRQGARLYMHEIGHAYWSTLTEEMKERLREMHAQEVQSKSGPLYTDGALNVGIRFVEDLDENGHQEWFAERIAALNWQWARRLKLGYGMLDRIADGLRTLLRRVAAIVWRVNPNDRVFDARFRDWIANGARAQAGVAARAQFATGPDERIEKIKEELAALKRGDSQEDASEIEARGAALQRELDALKKAAKRLSDEEVAAKLTPLKEDAKSWLPTSEELEAEKSRIENAAAAKKEAAPVERKTETKESLMADYAAAKAERDRALKSKDDAAFQDAQAMVSALKKRLDFLHPDWEDAPSKKSAPAREAQSLSEEKQVDEASAADSERSPFAPAEEAAPDRGRADLVYGQSEQPPGKWLKILDNGKEFIRGFRGSLPSLPAFPEAKWNKSDPFIARHGGTFYRRLEMGIRQLRNSNDFVQRQAEEQLRSVTDGLNGLAKPIGELSYRKFQTLKAREREAFRLGKQLPPEQRANLDKYSKEIEDHPVALFEQAILFLDLNWRQKNLKDSQGNPIALPFGLNATEVSNRLRTISERIAASAHRGPIEQAIQKHVALVKAVAEDLKSRELAATAELQNPFYFPHLTLEVEDPLNPRQMKQRELGVVRVKATTEADFRGYLIDPVGSEKAIETSYVKAMYYHLVQVGAHNTRADLVRDYVRPYDEMAKVQARAKELSKQRGYSVAWEQAFNEEWAKEGYVRYGADSKDAFTSIQIDRQKLAQRLGIMLSSEDIHEQLKELGIRGIKILPEDIREVLSAGEKETWILPARVADTLREIEVEDQQKDGPVRKLAKFHVGIWKQWKLFAPWNMIRYNFGNLTADLEKLGSADPGAVRELPSAWREVAMLFKRESDLPNELQEAIRLGVVNTVTAQELGQLVALSPFQELETKGERFRRLAVDSLSTLGIAAGLKKAGLPSMNSVQLSAFREAVFRYAKFKADLKRLQNGARPAYAGAYWKDIDAIQDSRKGAGDANFLKAAEISLKTFGDYSDLSQSGKTVRDYLIPFYSWLEVNAKYHANLFRNLRDMSRSAEYSKTDVARSAGVAAAGIVSRLALPYILTALWNSNSGMEDELSEEDRRRFHIIVGRDAHGKPMLITAPTALLDVAKWVSGAEFVRQMADVAHGRTDLASGLGAWLTQILPDLANNTIGQAGPVIRMPYTLIANKSAFPDVLDQRTIPAYDLKRVLLSQATDDFTADMVMRVADKEFLASKDLGDWAMQLILQVRKRDPEQWAFYEIKDKAADWVSAKTGNPRPTGGGYDAKHLQALRNFRKSIYRGDMEVAMRFYHLLLDYGYTAEQFKASIRSQDPLSEVPKALRKEFVDQLAPHERAQLERAYRFYSKMAAGKGSEARMFPSKRLTPSMRALRSPADDLLEQRFGSENNDVADRAMQGITR